MLQSHLDCQYERVSNRSIYPFFRQEFLTSECLATTSQNLSRYHIIPHLAHATLARATLGVLLQLNERIDKKCIRNFPLADYAARHWFNHCQFGNVTSTIQDATKCLFDQEKPHFSAEHFIVTYPEDVNARGGYYETPLLAAVRKEDVNITLSPPQHGVYVLGNGNMHRASSSERVDIVRLLVEHNADVNLPNEDGDISLYWASLDRKLEISRLLVERGANVHPRDKNGWTPLKRASHHGHQDVVRFLIDNGAHVESRDDEGWTPLHSASRRGHVHIVELLIQHGADVNNQNGDQKTP